VRKKAKAKPARAKKAVGKPARAKAPAKAIAKKKKVIAVGAHPGDIEYGCGGTIARLIAQGWEAVFIVVTNGISGPVTDENGKERWLGWRETRDIRYREDEKAAKLLGARLIHLDYNQRACWNGKKEVYMDFEKVDLDEYPKANGSVIETVITGPPIERMRQILRKEDPDVIITHTPFDYDVEHYAAIQLVWSAWHGLGVPNDAPRPSLLGWLPEYHLIRVEPHFSVRIDGYGKKKWAAIACHTSRRNAKREEIVRLRDRAWYNAGKRETLPPDDEQYGEPFVIMRGNPLLQ
jgi:LmbE family N-acetylglucosaminyl deacetylase